MKNIFKKKLLKNKLLYFSSKKFLKVLLKKIFLGHPLTLLFLNLDIEFLAINMFI